MCLKIEIALRLQGMRQEFGSAGAVCSIKESSGPQNQRVHIVLKAAKSAGAKGDVSKDLPVRAPKYTCAKEQLRVYCPNIMCTYYTYLDVAGRLGILRRVVTFISCSLCVKAQLKKT